MNKKILSNANFMPIVFIGIILCLFLIAGCSEKNKENLPQYTNKTSQPEGLNISERSNIGERPEGQPDDMHMPQSNLALTEEELSELEQIFSENNETIKEYCSSNMNSCITYCLQYEVENEFCLELKNQMPPKINDINRGTKK